MLKIIKTMDDMLKLKPGNIVLDSKGRKWEIDGIAVATQRVRLRNHVNGAYLTMMFSTFCGNYFTDRVADDFDDIKIQMDTAAGIIGKAVAKQKAKEDPIFGTDSKSPNGQKWVDIDSDDEELKVLVFDGDEEESDEDDKCNFALPGRYEVSASCSIPGSKVYIGKDGSVGVRIPDAPEKSECECGAAKAGHAMAGPAHSDWCPLGGE